MSVLSVHFPRSLRRSFSLRAKQAFPKETFAYCLGTKTGGRINLVSLYFPEIILAPDGWAFEVPEDEWRKAANWGLAFGYKILATLHSHPYPQSTLDDCAPSETDWGHLYPHLPLGICSVTESPKGLRTRYRFWPVHKPVNLLR